MKNEVLIFIWQEAFTLCRVHNSAHMPNVKDLVDLDSYPNTSTKNSDNTSDKLWVVVSRTFEHEAIKIHVKVSSKKKYLSKKQ